MLTFKAVIYAYNQLLVLNPGKALVIDADNAAFLHDGEMVGWLPL